MSAKHRLIDVRPQVAASVWPTPAQLLLLRAALWTGAEAREAWVRWQATENLAALDFSSWQMLPLAWRNLTAQGVADDALEECRGYHRYHWARNQRLLHRAAGWVRTWQERGVPVIVLKGTALAAGTYPDAGLRPMADTDLLVPPEHARTVGGWLQADGWRPQLDYFDWDRVEPDLQPGFNWRRGDDYLDLHWHVLHRCTRPEVTRRFWENARPLTLGGVATRQLGVEDTLLHACSHGVHYSPQAPFRWLADAAWILRRAGDTGFDWTRVTDMAARSGATLALQHGLEYAAAELRVPVPAGVLAGWRARRPSWRERLDYRRLTDPAEGGRWVRAGHLLRMLGRLGSHGSPAARWRRMERFLCARWETPTLGHAVRLALRKALTGHRGTWHRAGPGGVP